MKYYLQTILLTKEDQEVIPTVSVVDQFIDYAEFTSVLAWYLSLLENSANNKYIKELYEQLNNKGSIVIKHEQRSVFISIREYRLGEPI
jgi:hypothetical protein